MYQSNKLHTIMNQPLSRLFVNIDVKCNCYFCSAINTVYLPVVNSHWSSEHMRQTATTYGSVFRPMLTRCSFNTVIFESRLKSKWKTKQIWVIKKQQVHKLCTTLSYKLRHRILPTLDTNIAKNTRCIPTYA